MMDSVETEQDGSKPCNILPTKDAILLI